MIKISTVHFITGKGGTGKSQKLIAKVDELVSKRVQNVYVIVPEQFSFEFDKKLYGDVDHPETYSNDNVYSPSLYQGLGAYKYNHIKVTKFSKLAKEILKYNGIYSKDYINELSKIIAMHQAIKFSQPNLKVLDKQSKNVNFIELALQEVAELKKSNIDTARLELIGNSISLSKSSNASLKDKLNDVKEIYSQYEHILKANDLTDSLSDIQECNKLAKAEYDSNGNLTRRSFFAETTIFIDEFDAFTNDEFELLKTIIEQCDDLYISLRTDLNRKSTQFETVFKTYNRLYYYAQSHATIDPTPDNICTTPYRYTSLDLKAISDRIFSHEVPNPNTELIPRENVHIMECPTYYQECDYVCSQIRQLVMQGYHYNDIFVTARHIDHYEGIIERAFEKYDIPCFLSTDKSPMYSSVMLYFITLLDIVSTKTFNTDNVIKFAKNPLNNLSFEDISDLEIYCYKWNVKGKMWTSKFIQDENPNADITRENIITPLVELKSKLNRDGITAPEICVELFNYMERNHVRTILQNIIKTNQADQDVKKLSVANELVRVWDMLVTILDTIYSCPFLKEQSMNVKEFRDIVYSMVSQSKFKVAPQKLDAVSFSSSDNARYNSPKVVFVLGVNDGVFPSAVSNTGIFNQSDIKKLEQYIVGSSKEIDGLDVKFFKSIEDKTADERLVVYKTLTAPSEKLYLTYATSNVLGETLYPSYVVDSIRNLFSNHDEEVPIFDELKVEDICSTYRTSYDYVVKNLFNHNAQVDTLRDMLQSHETYQAKLEHLDRISTNTQFKIQDKDLAKKLFQDKIKIYPTKFERFNECHFQYFCDNGLKIKKTAKMELADNEIGNIIHHCLENIIKNNTKEDFIALREHDIKIQIETFANEYKETYLGGDYGKTSRFEYNFKRVKGSILHTIKHLQEEFRQLEFTPVGYEFTIDEHGDSKPLAIKNDDGVELLLCGKVDRVDIFTNEKGSYVRIIDYKSYDKTINTSKIPYGIDMQMFLYLFAITGKDGKYSNYQPAGVLYMPVDEIRPSSFRSSGTHDLAKTINTHFKMKGMVLDEEEVLKAMEKDLNGVYIPFNKTKPHDKRVSKVLTETQFEKIKALAESLLLNMADCLSNGDISAQVLKFDKNGGGDDADIDDNNYDANDSTLDNNVSRTCKTCDYWSICGNYSNANCKLVHLKDAKKEYEKLISEEKGENKDGE